MSDKWIVPEEDPWACPWVTGTRRKKVNEEDIRALLEEARQLKQQHLQGVAIARLQDRLDKTFPEVFRPTIDGLFVSWLRSGQPVSDELVKVMSGLQKQPQILEWLLPERDEED